MARLEPAATDLPVRFVNWIRETTQASGAMGILPVTPEWLNGKNTAWQAPAGASSSRNADFIPEKGVPGGFVTLISIQKSRKHGPAKADFSDGSSLLFTNEYLPYGGMDSIAWEAGRDLNDEEEKAIRFAADCYRAEKTALHLVARAEQNSFGLIAKLERRGYAAAVAKAVVSCFLSRSLLDDRRYTERWIRMRLRSGKAFSPRWLLVSLGKKGINRDSSRTALEEVLDPETEYALLLRFLEKNTVKNPGASGINGDISMRIHLKYEGFSTDVLDMYFSNKNQ